jgi:transcriptional regulator with XRE-family HTH domain
VKDVHIDEKDILNRLENLMNEKKVTRMELSRLSGIPYTTINNFWSQGVANMKLSNLRKLASFFNISLDELVTGNKPEAHVELMRILKDEEVTIDINGKAMDHEFRQKLVNVISALIQ